jgi:predicted mannosyl-3-phosphoglycerate phosphatase (HAD superfamily)
VANLKAEIQKLKSALALSPSELISENGEVIFLARFDQ